MYTKNGVLFKREFTNSMHIFYFLYVFTHYFLLSSTEKGRQQQITPNKQKQTNRPNSCSSSIFLTTILAPFYKGGFGHLIKGHLFKSFKDDKWHIWPFIICAAEIKNLNANDRGRQKATPHNMNLFLFWFY